MLIFSYDTETTGLPNWKLPSGDPAQPHLVQLAGILADTETRSVVSSIDLIIRPDGWEIPEVVTAIHGITTERALKVGVSEAEAFAAFIALWGGRQRIAHNRTFDQRIMRIAAKRYADEALIERWADKATHGCTMMDSKEPMGMSKWPKLSEAYKHFTGKPLENAHSAMADARACLDVYFGILDAKEAA
jgi:DNA polymerase-3 subunit epsilon